MAMLVQLVDGVASNKFVIQRRSVQVGRAPDNDIYIDDPMVSSHHAVIEVEEPQDADLPNTYFIRDLDSTNSTFVNDKKVTRQQLKHEDVVRFGLHSFKFLDEAALDIEKTKKIKKSWIPGVYYTKD